MKSTMWRTMAILVVLSLLIGGCGPQATSKPKLPEKIVIGCLEPLTGRYAVFGTEAKIGMEIAVRHINEAGGIQSMGGISLELVVEDAGERPTAPASAPRASSANTARSLSSDSTSAG